MTSTRILTTKFNGGTVKPGLSKDAAKDTILRLFSRSVRPVLIGTASVELRWPLSWVEQLFEELVHEKKIRPCNARELWQWDVICAFLLVK